MASSSWNILILHNKVSGFRQVVFRDGHIIFTRLIAYDAELTTEGNGAYVVHEIESSVEYLKRFGLHDHTHLRLHCIASPEIVQHVLKQIPHITTIGHHPIDIAKYCHIDTTDMAHDRFADASCAMAITWESSGTLPLSTHKIVQANHIRSLRQWSIASSYLVVPGMLISMSMMLGTIYKDNKDLSELNITLNQAKQEWDAVSQIEFDEGLVQKVHEIERASNVLTMESETPMRVLQLFLSVKDPQLIVNDFSWEVGPVTTSAHEMTGSHNPLLGLDFANNPSQSEALGDDDYQITALLNANFITHNTSYEATYKAFALMIERIQKAFKDYQVDYTRATDNISVGSDEEKDEQGIPIRFTIRKIVHHDNKSAIQP